MALLLCVYVEVAMCKGSGEFLNATNSMPVPHAMINQLCTKNPFGISISGLVVEYIVAIDVTRVRFPADALLRCRATGLGSQSEEDF